MSSGDDLSSMTAEEFLDRPEYADVARAVRERSAMITAMHRHARAHGLLCDEAFVSRHYDWFYRWHIGIFATGYLMNRTGVKRQQVNPPKGMFI